MPIKAAPKIETNAFFGAHFSSITATTMPKDEANKARRGDPEELRRPKAAGAHPDRANENNTRDAAYKAAFAPESAAVKITKVIMWDAAGM